MLLICFGINPVTTLINGEQDFVETAVYVLCMLQMLIICVIISFPTLTQLCFFIYSEKFLSIPFSCSQLSSSSEKGRKVIITTEIKHRYTHTDRFTQRHVYTHGVIHRYIQTDRQKYIDSHKYIHQVTHRYTQMPPPQTHIKTQQYIEKQIETYTQRKKGIDTHRHTMTNLGTHREMDSKEKILKYLVKIVAFT